MSDIRHSLLRRDPLSAAKEALYHLDISLGSALQTSGGSGGSPPIEKSSVDLVEEFIFHAPKDNRNVQTKVREWTLLCVCVCVCVCLCV